MNNIYLILKTMHILGVILFLGNIIVTAWWKLMADRHGDPIVVAFAQRQVTLTDFVFTAGGGALLLLGGLGNALWYGMDYLHTPWMAWGLVLFSASGVIWVTVLIPVQIKQARLARTFAKGGLIPAEYRRLGRIWNGFGLLATVLPLAAVYLMVFKPA